MGLPTNAGANTQDTYPEYLATAHVGFLVGGTGVDSANLSAVDPGTSPYNAVAFTQQAVDENPYFAAEAYSPETDLQISSEAIDAFEQLVATYLTSSPSTTGEQKTIDDFVAKAASLFGTYAFDFTSDVDAEVADFEASSEDEFLRSRSSFEAAMFNINAIETSPYIMGLAVLDSERYRSLATLRSKLLSQGRRDKNVFMVQLAELMVQLQGRNAGLYQILSSLKADQARFSYTSNREYAMQNIEYDVGEVEWELESLKKGASILGAIQGIPLSPKAPSNLATAVSTALSVGPQVGAALGNATHSPVIGIAGGVLASLFAYSANING